MHCYVIMLFYNIGFHTSTFYIHSVYCYSDDDMVKKAMAYSTLLQYQFVLV